MRHSSFSILTRQFSCRHHSSASIASPSLVDRLPSRKTWSKVWGYVLWIPAIIFVNDHVVSICPVDGISMRPTLNPDTNYGRRDWVILWKFLLKPQRGDIVVLKSPRDPNLWVIKRIIATEGDTVETRPSYPERNVMVPQNHLWVEGDEGFHSNDSNVYGPVTKVLLIGKVEYVIWPWPRIVNSGTSTHDRVIPSAGSNA